MTNTDIDVDVLTERLGKWKTRSGYLYGESNLYREIDEAISALTGVKELREVLQNVETAINDLDDELVERSLDISWKRMSLEAQENLTQKNFRTCITQIRQALKDKLYDRAPRHIQRLHGVSLSAFSRVGSKQSCNDLAYVEPEHGQ